MTYLRLPEEAVAALADGRDVTLRSMWLGREDYNGSLTLVPPGSDTDADDPFEVDFPMMEGESGRWLERRCVECGHEVKQLEDDTSATFCMCRPYGPQMVPPPYPEGVDEEGSR